MDGQFHSNKFFSFLQNKKVAVNYVPACLSVHLSMCPSRLSFSLTHTLTHRRATHTLVHCTGCLCCSRLQFSRRCDVTFRARVMPFFFCVRVKSIFCVSIAFVFIFLFFFGKNERRNRSDLAILLF